MKNPNGPSIEQIDDWNDALADQKRNQEKKFMRRIRIEKIAEVPGGLPANPKDAHVPGETQTKGFSLPIEYWITGQLPEDIKVGKSVLVLRDSRNGIPMDGFFQTSPVTEVSATEFKTKNSVYRYQFIPPLTE